MEMEKNTVYCEACLSVNRRMHHLSQLLPLIQETKLEELHLAGSICWECKAHLMKYFKFKSKVRLAQELLQQQKQKEILPSLSLLSKTLTLNIKFTETEYKNKSCDPSPNDSVSNKGKETVNETDPADLLLELPLLNHAIKIEEENENLPTESEEIYNSIKLEAKQEIEITSDNETNVNPGNFHTNHETIQEYYEVLSRITTVKHEELDIINEEPKECEERLLEFGINTASTSELPAEKNMAQCSNKDDSKREINKTKCSIDNNSLNKAQCPKETVPLTEEMIARGVVRCNLCSGLYPDSRSLDTHQKRRHRSNYYQFNCDICKKSFKAKQRLEKHMATHSEAIARRLAYCDTCRVQYRNIYTYRQHVKNHAIHNKGRFQCTLCDSGFTTAFTLRKHHEFRHLGISQFKCDDCDKVFVSRYRLKEHNQKKHGLQRPRNHHCQVCQKSFYDAKCLSTHMYTHSSERPFMCSECGDTFRQEASLYTHIRLKHKKLKRNLKKKDNAKKKKERDKEHTT